MNFMFNDKAVRDKFMYDSGMLRLGIQIRINRKSRNITLTNFAKALKITRQALLAIEKGRSSKVSIGTLTKMAKIFDCCVDINFVESKTYIKKLITTNPEVVSTFVEEEIV